MTHIDTPHPNSPTLPSPNPPTVGDLGFILDFWRRELRLMDWDLTLDTYRLKQWVAMGKNAYTAGFCWSNRCVGAAKIGLLEVEDLADDIATSCRDIEVSLVHELLHLLMPVSASDGSDADGERAINRVAESLVRLRRLADAPFRYNVKESP